MPNQPSQEEPPSFWSAVNLAWELGYLIALPAFAFGFGGAYVDKYYGTSPFGVVIGLLLAMVLSGVGVWRKVKEIRF